MHEVPLVELRSVSLGARELRVIDSISLSIAEGRTSVIMGNAGSGKSSLVKLAAGIVIPDRGEVRYRGKPLGALSKRELLAFRRRSGFVFQDAALWANQSLFDNIAFPLRFHEPSIGQREVEGAVLAAAELAGCRRDLSSRPADISAGEARLVGLARALVLDPELLFLDDPLSDLDEGGRERVLRLLGGLKAGGRSIVVTGASPAFAKKIADTVFVVAEGRLGASGSYDEAAAWPDPLALGLPGPLEPRRNREGLVGAWEDALAGEPEDGDPSGAGAQPGKPASEGR